MTAIQDLAARGFQAAMNLGMNRPKMSRAMNQKAMNAAAPVKRTRIEPRISIKDPNFVWIPSHQTDVQRTWRKFGWRPLKEIAAEGRAA